MSKNIPSQKFVGMQVVDSKGAIIGSVKDFSVNILDKEILLVIATKSEGDIEVPLTNVSSIEDVVLLAKPGETLISTVEPSTTSTTITCSSCGATLPAHAKFCAKCGSKI